MRLGHLELLGRRGPARPHGLRSVDEQVDRGGVAAHRQRVHGHEVLAVDGEALPAGGQDADVGSPGEDRLGQLRGGVDDVLAVVEHEQPGLHPEHLGHAVEQARADALVDAEGVGHGQRDGGRVRRRQLAEPEAPVPSDAARAEHTSAARRVLPTPPVPTSVTSRLRPSSSATSATSSSRPRNELE